jgi:hypothetical protein
MTRRSPVRRSTAVLMVVASLLLLTAPAAAARGPEITRLPPSVVPPEGFVGTCDFPASLTDAFSNSKEMAFPADRNGDQLYRYTGGYVSTFRNEATGASRELRFFSKIDLLFRANGTVDVAIGGTFLMWITDADTDSIFDPGVYLMTGHLTTVLDAETFFTVEPERFKGRMTNLCDALA